MKGLKCSTGGLMLSVRQHPHIKRGDVRHTSDGSGPPPILCLVRAPPVTQKTKSGIAPERERKIVLWVSQGDCGPCAASKAALQRCCDDQGLRVEPEIQVVVNPRSRLPSLSGPLAQAL